MNFFHEYLPWIYDVNIFSVSLRLLLSVVLGGIIGLERGSANQAAGFRTHILVCLGACLVMLTNQFIFQNISDLSDPGRMGAQVITGVGFLGAGTILLAGKRIKGLTTAAGLWASACTGLALGIGFYEGAVISAILILSCLAILPKVEAYFYSKSRTLDVYLEVSAPENVMRLLNFIEAYDIITLTSNIIKTELVIGQVGLYLSLRMPRHMDRKKFIESLKVQNGILWLEEL